MTLKTCPCGSGLTPSALHDARGIFLTFACNKCEQRKLAGFRPEVLTDPNYAADDLGDDDEPSSCAHEWVYTGTAYGGDDERWHGEGRCYCAKCGADGDG